MDHEAPGGQTHWIPLADLMTGLMMVYMLLTAAFMLRVEQTTTLVVDEFEKTKSEMKLALQKEFSKDLKQWNAEMLGDMTIRFKDPAVLFATGSSDLKPQFKKVLGDFFPRYLKLLTSEKYKPVVKEVRIEGHTSSFWGQTTSTQQAYFRNMELSQARTRSALEYILSLSEVQDQADWLLKHTTANGLSSSRPVASDSDKDGALANQRVEFRIVTTADERIQDIARGMREGK